MSTINHAESKTAWGPEQQAGAVEGIINEGGVNVGGAWVGKWYPDRRELKCFNNRKWESETKFYKK